MKNYYEILGVKRNASREEIKKAYTEISLKHHPDKALKKTKEEIEEFRRIFQEANEAFKVLENENNRKLYELLLQDEKEQLYIKNIKFRGEENWIFSLILKYKDDEWNEKEKEIIELINVTELIKQQDEHRAIDIKLIEINKKKEQITKKIKEIKNYREKIIIERQNQSFQETNKDVNKFLNENKEIKQLIYVIAEEIWNIKKEFEKEHFFLSLNDLIVVKTIKTGDKKKETQISFKPNIIINNEILEQREKKIYEIISQLEKKIKNVTINIENCKKKLTEQKAWKIEEKIETTKKDKQKWKEQLDDKKKRKSLTLNQKEKETIKQIIDILDNQEELFNEIKGRKIDVLLEFFEKRIEELLNKIETHEVKKQIKEGKIVIKIQNETKKGIKDKIEQTKKETEKKIEEIKKKLQQELPKQKEKIVSIPKQKEPIINTSDNNLQDAKVAKRIEKNLDIYQKKLKINNQISKTKKDNHAVIIMIEIIAITSFIALVFRLLYFFNTFLFEKYFEKIFNKFFSEEDKS